MKINLHWPKTKNKPNLNSWHVILWRLLIFPFVVIVGSVFYSLLILFHFDFYQAERFRKEWFDWF